VAVSLLLAAVWAQSYLHQTRTLVGHAPCHMAHSWPEIQCYAWSCFCEAGMLWFGFHLNLCWPT